MADDTNDDEAGQARPRPGAAAAPSAPRYQQLARELRARIEAGTYPVGGTLPTEQELCAEFDASRYTVREALRRLVLQGLVRRRQGSGTEVIAGSTAGAGYLHVMRSLSELFEYASDTRLDIASLEMETPTPEVALLLGRVPGREWLAIKAVRRTRAGQPISFVRIWLHEDFSALSAELRGHAGPIYQLVEARFGVIVAEVVQEIAGEPLPDEAATSLRLRPGSASVRLLRRYLDAGDRPLIVSLNWHPAETFSYSMRLRREDASA